MSLPRSGKPGGYPPNHPDTNQNFGQGPSFPSAASLGSYPTGGSYSHDDSETAPLSANGVYNELSGAQQQYYPPQNNPLPPQFLNQDPNGGGGFLRRPQFPRRAGSEVSVQSEADWRKRAASVQRGVTRKVKLTKGNFIANYSVPPAIVNSIEARYKDAAARAGRAEEFTHLRYTAATVDPNYFTPENGYRLRQKIYGRETELLIAITSYNEDKNLYSRTLHSVMTNVRDIVKSNSKFWRRGKEEGTGSWEKIVVVLVADGIDPCSKDTLDLLATVGVYQDNIMKKNIDGKDTVAHIFEYTTQLSVDTKPTLIVPMPQNEKHNMVPVQFIFCLKQKNAKKINSHRWVFNAFGPQLEPEVCILIDAGTKPGKLSLYELWSAFYNDKSCGGACGEIYAMLSGGKKLINPLVAAQNFEYKMSNILDKPLEASFGYVSVLPGAFSAYRYRALLGRPLQQYFHGDGTNPVDKDKGTANMSIFAKNMYLAEDRILCFELVSKANATWLLKYVKAAKGETDVPEGAAEFISQRRRWLNGSMAASVYSIWHFYRMYRSNHNVLRMFVFHIQLIFNICNLIMTWFSLANLWLCFAIIIELVPSSTGVQLFYNEEITHWANLAFQWVYVAFVVIQFILALGNRPKGEVGTYVVSFVVFGFFAYYLMVCAVILTIHAFTAIDFNDAPTVVDKVQILFNGTNGVLLAALASTFGLYIFSSLLYFDPWHIITSFPQYIVKIVTSTRRNGAIADDHLSKQAVAPSMTNILTVYAFNNLHDVSWGTKGSDKADALPTVSSGDGKEGEVIEVQKTEADLDSAFKETVRKALTPTVSVEANEKPSAEDENKTFRTRLVVVWIITNGALILAIQNANGLHTTEAEVNKKTNAYFKVILWTTAALSLIRFVGCVWFWFWMNVARCFRKT
ncbi:class III chitin synthase [Meredithblackwellia eburnea MCA 4105]